MSTATSPALQRIVERIRSARADGATLRIRGHGTKDFYGEAPSGEPLDTTEAHGITSYEPSELVVTARAGTPLAELEATLAERGQCLPFEPPRFARPDVPASGSSAESAGAAQAGAGTVGGMVAAGISGPARASVGAVRDYVLGTTLVNGRGEVLSFGGQVMKNVAGYDVSRVLVGSLGALGVIAEVSLKVLPQAPAEATLRFECTQADALRLLNGWGGQPLPLNASRWMPADTGSVADSGDDRGGDRAGSLWLRLRGAAAAVAAAGSHLGGERCDDDLARFEWEATRDFRLAPFAHLEERDLWRLSVPQTAPALALDGLLMIDWHGAQRWYLAPTDQGERLRAAARKVGGHATLFKATGVDRRFERPDPASMAIHQALVREFDPDGVFHRARLYPDL